MTKEKRLEKNKKFIGSATSFTELDAEEELLKENEELENLSFQFWILSDNILFDSMTTDKKMKLKELANDYINRLDNLPIETMKSKNPLKEISLIEKAKRFVKGDSKRPVSLLKTKDGKTYVYGRFTNYFEDREEETLKGSAHEEFMTFLDANPDEAPYLWVWHEKATQYTNKADWWDFADGHVVMLWPLEDNEVKSVEMLLSRFDMGMSHGFTGERDPDNPNVFIKYRTNEASILPLEYAANVLTDVNIMENNKMAFLPDKRETLKLRGFADEEINQMEKGNEEAKQAGLDSEIPYLKEKEEVKKEEDTISQEEETETVATEEMTETVVSEGEATEDNEFVTMQDLSVFAETFIGKLEANLDARFKNLETKLDATEEKEAKRKTRNQSIAQMLGGLNVQSSIKDKGNKPMAKNDPIRKSSPMETNTPEKVKGGLGFFGQV